MRDHGRILGSLFVAWAVFQLAGAVVAAFVAPAEQRPPTLFWVVSALAAVAYAWIGAQLRRHDPRVRVPAIILSGLALLSFPFGTALGAYGFWVLLKRKELAPSP